MSARPRRAPRQTLRRVHRWLGLALVLPMLVQGLTGTVLALTPTWQTWQTAAVASPGPQQPASAIVAAATARGMLALRYDPAANHGAAVVDLAPAGQRRPTLEVTIDPASLAVLGTRRTSPAWRWIHDVHENLLLPFWWGRSLVGWFGAGLLLLGLSGLALWWPAPGQARAAVTIDWHASGTRLQRSVHAATGLWACAMLVVMSASGASLAFPQTLKALVGPGASEARHPPTRPQTLDLDAVLAMAAQTVPGAAVTSVRLPAGPRQPVLLHMRLPGEPAGSPQLAMTLDADGRTVRSLEDPRRMGLGMQAANWLSALHHGDAFGLPWRLAVALTGLALPVLAVTGTVSWALRRHNRQRVISQRAASLSRVAG